MRKAGRVSPANGLCRTECSKGEECIAEAKTAPDVEFRAGLKELKMGRKTDSGKNM